ncbi:PREDICTED: microfibril-associated glycoprotein 4-like [Branchiostoma belcheri]|uniref:Microfibril-associated glycoprotein 4-like n=1 Tax=Branchiostoma belcheri TaxID=7741 RepID=A0A6P4ZL63_BRABE|nr:PREDICTED: microfibril-associated glycoprotein 4-like [Branchiostoma belcheri]
MASVLLLAVFLLCSSFPVGAQDTRTDQAGSVLREYVDKGYCTYTYVVPPGSRTEGCAPPGLESQLAETKEETDRLKNQVDRLSSLVETLLSQQSDLSNQLSEERARSAQLEQKVQEQETRVRNLNTTLYEHDMAIKQRQQCTCERMEPLDSISSTAATLPTETVSTAVGLITASDCADLYAAGQTTSGVYNIRLGSSNVETYCDMDTAGGGWTVIQRRQDGSVPFDRTWEEYKHGFGNKSGEYWLGNENIHLLTSQKNYTLRVDLEDWRGETRYATYSSFKLSGESDQYRLHISGYSGDAGDSMDYHNERMFSTVDRDNDAYSGYHCSQHYGQAGWWFWSCGYSLNGRYLGNCRSSCAASQGVVWYHWRGWSYSLKSVSMKIRP